MKMMVVSDTNQCLTDIGWQRVKESELGAMQQSATSSSGRRKLSSVVRASRDDAAPAVPLAPTSEGETMDANVARRLVGKGVRILLPIVLFRWRQAFAVRRGRANTEGLTPVPDAQSPIRSLRLRTEVFSRRTAGAIRQINSRK